MDDKTCATCLHWKSTAYSMAVDPRPESQVRECLCLTSPWACETCGRDQPACDEYRAVQVQEDAA